MLNLDRSKTDPATGLAYNERSLAYASTQGLIATCLPNAKKEEVADSFKSCQGKAMEEVCVFAKRGWLVKNAQEDAVANLDLLTKSFTGLEGGDAAVKKCMKIKEEAAVLNDEYEYYDYADYYDEWDYLEEGEGRRKREAGNGGKNGDKKGNGQENNGKGKKGRNAKNSNKDGEKKKGSRKNSKKEGKKGRNANNSKKGGGKKKGKKAKGSNSRKSTKNYGGEKKNVNKGGKSDGNRKFVKKPNKEPSAENAAKPNKRLNKLGFTKMPTKSTLEGLNCMWNKLEDLLVKCGEKILSKTP